MAPIASNDGELGVLYVALCMLVAMLGGRAAGSMRTTRRMYHWLRRPAWAPPAWVFPVAWLLVVYPTRGVALWLLRRTTADASGGPWSGATTVPLVLAVVACALEIAWSWLFFGRGARLAASALIVAVAGVATAAAVTAFGACPSDAAPACRPRDATAAGVLLAVGAAWILFATALCFEIYRRNRHRPSYYAAVEAAKARQQQQRQQQQ